MRARKLFRGERKIICPERKKHLQEYSVPVRVRLVGTDNPYINPKLKSHEK